MEIDFLIVDENTIIPIEAKSSNKISHADGRQLNHSWKNILEKLPSV